MSKFKIFLRFGVGLFFFFDDDANNLLELLLLNEEDDFNLFIVLRDIFSFYSSY